MEEIEKKEYVWLVENDDDTFTVKTKQGDYIMEELTDDEIEKITKLSQKVNKTVQALLAAKCIKSPEVSDSDFGKLKSSTTSRLKFTAMKINGLMDFL